MGQLAQLQAAGTDTPTMGNLDKIKYSHEDMIDFILANPRISQGQLAIRYGYTQGWVSNIMASDAWKSAYEARRAQMADPILADVMRERFDVQEKFKGMTLRSLERLQEKLDAPQVSDNVVLKALELGAKAIGIGGNAPAPAPASDHLATLANRLIELQSNVRKGVTYEGQAEALPAAEDAQGQ